MLPNCDIHVTQIKQSVYGRAACAACFMCLASVALVTCPSFIDCPNSQLV